MGRHARYCLKALAGVRYWPPTFSSPHSFNTIGRMPILRLLRLLWFGVVERWRGRSHLVRVSWDEGWTGSAARAPFELPLCIAILGRRWRTSVLRAVRAYPPGAFALRLSETVDDLRTDPPPHILVVDSHDIAAVHSDYLTAAASSDGLPALIVAPGNWWQLLGTAMRLPRGAALVLAPRRNFRKFFAGLMDQIAADRPLDTATANAARHTLTRVHRGAGMDSRPPTAQSEWQHQHPYRKADRWLLFLDRYVNQALRMTDALEMLRQEFELRGEQLYEPRAALRDLAMEKLRLSDMPLSSNSGQAVADVVLLRAFYREGGPRTLHPGTTLQSGRRYLVQVHVGSPIAASIVKRDAERSKIGPVLRTLKPQLFEVIIQARDFELRSPMKRFLYMEPTGAFCRVRFGVTAPKRTGIAKMRLVMFSGNQMLQAFEVQANVADREYASGAGATAEMSFAQTEELTGERELPARLATISVNRSAETHTVLMKGSDAAAGFDLSDSAVRNTLRAYRRILKNATSMDGKTPRFPGLVTEEPTDESRKYIRQIAVLGQTMHNALYDPDDAARKALLENIRTTEEGVLSIVRHDFGFAWPWPIIYDFDLPVHIVGTIPRVCFGQTENGQPCGHDGREAVCCVRGFWGYRLQIEELHGAQVNRQRLNAVGQHSVLLMYIEASGTTAGQSLGPALNALGGVPGKPPTLLSDLWDPKSRPAIAVLLGHFENNDLPLQPSGARIVVGGTPSNPTDWLQDTHVMSLVKNQGPWPAPNSVVMLLSCESAAASPATLSSLVLSFLRAHAGAVVGTECLAFSGLLARFGREFAEGMIREHQSLGEVLLSTRRRLLGQGNPLAFVVNAIGVADLKIG